MITHELFHLFFGVFDEYANVMTGATFRENSSCPANTRGDWVDWANRNTSCKPSSEFCVSIPNEENVPQSIMAYSHLNVSMHICKEGGRESPMVPHNPVAHTMHNLKCNFKSVAHVMEKQTQYKTITGSYNVHLKRILKCIHSLKTFRY